MKRLGIFVFFDKEGIVDRYVEYLLAEMNQVLDSLVIVCNGYVNEEGIQKLNKYSKNIYKHENLGFDAGAYRYILIEKDYVTHLCEYDELVLFNDTCYGPIYPIQEVFEKMESRNVNFWGMTQYEDRMIAKHIQSYFLVFDKEVIRSQCFCDFWNKCDTNTTNVGRIITEFEIKITQVLTEHGFNWDTFVEPEKYFGLNPYEYFSDQLIKKDHFPFLKKKRFIYKTLNQGIDKDLAVAMEFIDKNTSYPVDLIYENAIRLYDVFDLRETLNLNYVLTHKKNLYLQKEYKAAVFLYLKYESLVDEEANYVKEIPSYVDIYIVSGVPKIIDHVNDRLSELSNHKIYYEIDMTKNEKASFFSKVLGDAIKYDYCCFLYDSQMKINSFINDTQFIVWDNLIKSRAYIENVLATLEINTFLGVLTVPYMYHSEYISTFYSDSCEESKSWKENLLGVGQVLSKMGICNHMSTKKAPISYIPCFWCKTKALHQLFVNEMKDNYDQNRDGIFDMIAPYLAQANGFYTGQVENTDFAALTLINYEGIIRKLLINKEALRDDSEENIFSENIEQLLKNIPESQEIFIYGTGLFGNIILRKLEERKVKGFIVSDAYYHDEKLMGIPIYKISEMKDAENMVIIVGMDRKNTEDIKPLLKKYKQVVYLW